MTPKKIYLSKLVMAGAEILDKPVSDDDVEYIRKDLLLEWAKEMKEQVGLGLNAYDMGEENRKADILNALIDKLNSL